MAKEYDISFNYLKTKHKTADISDNTKALNVLRDIFTNEKPYNLLDESTRKQITIDLQKIIDVRNKSI